MKKQTIYQIFAASSLSFQLSKIYIAAFILLFALGAETFAQNGTYTTIDPPNSTSTGIYGINNSGSMSGTYQGSNNDSHVFNLTNGVFTIFDVLGNLQFDDNLGFNASGDIVSTYYDFQINRVVGFRMSNGSITKINPSSLPQNPSSLATQSINESGLIIGTYDTTEVPYRKVFKWINGIITTFSLPWAGDVSAINSSGDFVGTYADANSVRHGYRWTNGSITIIDPPGSVETRAKRLNNAGEVLGTYKDSNSRTHGYIWINGSFIIIDPPGSSYTSYTGPLGINSAGDVTGSYTDTNGRSHGYKWINGVFTIIDPPGTTYTYPRGINDNGDIVGNYGDASFKSHGFKFSNGNTLTATVQTNPVGRNFTVDGTAYSSTQTFTWQQGSTHTISTSSPQTGSGGTQYVWSNWSDGGAISHAVAPTTNATYTANFTTPVPVVTDVIREFPGVFLTGFR